MSLLGPVLVTMALSSSATTRRWTPLTFSSYHPSPWAGCSRRVYTGATGAILVHNPHNQPSDLRDLLPQCHTRRNIQRGCLKPAGDLKQCDLLASRAE